MRDGSMGMSRRRSVTCREPLKRVVAIGPNMSKPGKKRILLLGFLGILGFIGCVELSPTHWCDDGCF